MATHEEQKAFIEKIAPLAQASEIKYGILSSVTIAQAILESGWGKSELAVNANNYFGIKAKWGETCYTKVTTEYDEDGTEYETEADFRAFDSLADSVDAHGKFLQKSRYNLVRSAPTYRQTAYALQKAGYATAPNYATELIRLIETYNLDTYDRPVFCPECGARIRECETCGYVQHEVSP